MKKTYIFLGLLALILAGLGGIYYYFQKDKNNDQNQNQVSEAKEITAKNCLVDDCLQVNNLEYPVGDIKTSVKVALDGAIDDEYKALSTYVAVIDKFGSIRPFSMIKGAEEQHIASLKALYDKYGLDVPENSYLNNVEAPATVKNACQTGVDAEIANAALYRDKLIPAVAGYDDIISVFTSLMNASYDKHLPAFEKCN